MQLPAGPDLPHTRAQPAHWIITAAALAAVAGAAALVQPDAATARPAGDAAGAPRASAVDYPIDCGPSGVGVVVTHDVAVDLDGDQRAETVAAVRCDAGGGSPPSGLYVLAEAAEPDAPPRLVETLLDPGERLMVARLTAQAGSVTARLVGPLSPGVDRSELAQRDVTWSWHEGRLRLDTAPPAASTSA